MEKQPVARRASTVPARKSHALCGRRVAAKIFPRNPVFARFVCPPDTPGVFLPKFAAAVPGPSAETTLPPARKDSAASNPHCQDKSPALRHFQNKKSGCAPEIFQRYCARECGC